MLISGVSFISILQLVLHFEQDWKEKAILYWSNQIAIYYETSEAAAAIKQMRIY